MSHQAPYGAAGDIEAFPLHLSPDLAHAIDSEVFLEDPVRLGASRMA